MIDDESEEEKEPVDDVAVQEPLDELDEVMFRLPFPESAWKVDPILPQKILNFCLLSLV